MKSVEHDLWLAQCGLVADAIFYDSNIKPLLTALMVDLEYIAHILQDRVQDVINAEAAS